MVPCHNATSEVYRKIALMEVELQCIVVWCIISVWYHLNVCLHISLTA